MRLETCKPDGLPTMLSAAVAAEIGAKPTSTVGALGGATLGVFAA
jgi:hypothetical protein